MGNLYFDTQFLIRPTSSAGFEFENGFEVIDIESRILDYLGAA